MHRRTGVENDASRQAICRYRHRTQRSIAAIVNANAPVGCLRFSKIDERAVGVVGSCDGTGTHRLPSAPIIAALDIDGAGIRQARRVDTQAVDRHRIDAEQAIAGRTFRIPRARPQTNLIPCLRGGGGGSRKTQAENRERTLSRKHANANVTGGAFRESYLRVRGQAIAFVIVNRRIRPNGAPGESIVARVHVNACGKGVQRCYDIEHAVRSPMLAYVCDRLRVS